MPKLLARGLHDDDTGTKSANGTATISRARRSPLVFQLRIVWRRLETKPFKHNTAIPSAARETKLCRV